MEWDLISDGRLTCVNCVPYGCIMATTTPRDPRIPDLLSLVEAAEILGISKQATQKRAERGQLLGARAGNAWVFRRALVEAARDSSPSS